MTPLLPALYFLASPSQQSRGLNYRTPRIHASKGSVYPAICTHNQTALEYRIFETCYDKPLVLVDFLIVIAKTLQFYQPDTTDTSMKLVQLGIKDGTGLNRFYYTTKHLQALDRGLKWLKPAYKSIVQLKQERDFKIDRKVLQSDAKERREEYTKTYKTLKMSRHNERLAIYHEGLMKGYRRLGNGSTDNPHDYARKYLTRYLEENGNYLKGNLRQYVRQMSDKFMTDTPYKITV